MGFFDRFRKKNRQTEAFAAKQEEAPVKKQEEALAKQQEEKTAAAFEAKPLSGSQLKKRLMEWDVNWSDEKLTPYFDEALLSVKESDDPSVLFWGCSSLHELLRISSDCFRERIGEIAQVERARDEVALLHINAIRYYEPDQKMYDIIMGNLKKLTGKSMKKEFEDAKKFNAAWTELANKAGRYPQPGTYSERKKFEEEVYEICSRLNSCSAVGRLVDVTVQLMQAVNRAHQMGNNVICTTINLKTGEKETSELPDIHDTERFGFHMIGSLPKEALQQCLDGDDFSTDPESREGNYQVMLERGAKIAGLL